MQKRIFLTTVVLTLAALACNAPQPSVTDVTPRAACTPPPCAEDEVYYCPGECPGGCGTECVTPTPGEPTETPMALCTPPPCTEEEVYYCPESCPGGCGTECATPTPKEPTATPLPQSPTDTPIAVCTPPPCTTEEVYYCPGNCPGGCGTECATPTAPVEGTTPPAILSFTADRMTLVEGESVTLSWQATGGTEAVIQWVTSEAIQANAPGPLNPDGGTVTITPTGDGHITLIVRNDAGFTEAPLQLTITCPYPWAPALSEPPPLASGCPAEAIFSSAAQQSFENGFMIWVGANRKIYVFYYPQGGSLATYEIYTDLFHDGDPESDPDVVPPAGLYQPIRGFGLVWRTNSFVRDRLGWATAPESEFQTWLQSYSGVGLHANYTLLKGIDGTVYHMTAMGSVWEPYQQP